MIGDIAAGLCQERPELAARDEEQKARIACYGCGCAALAVQQGDLAEEFPGTEHIEDQFFALQGIHGEGDPAFQDTIEAVTGIAVLKDHAPGRNAPASRTFGQLLHIPAPTGSRRKDGGGASPGASFRQHP